MNSMINNTDDNYYAVASMNNSDYEKNEHYLECGLIKGRKRDSKSRGKIAVAQMEARQTKIDELVGQLPKKMKQKLAETAVVTAVTPGKSKIEPKTKLFHSRQQEKQTQDHILGHYDDQLLVEEDVVDEIYDEAYENYLDAMNEELKEAEEARYQAYLEKKFLWDFPDDNMSHWELMCLKDEVQAYEAELNAKWENEKQIKETVAPSEYEGEDHDLWIKYGLTKEQYHANQEYERNKQMLLAFYGEDDYANHPEYAIQLETAIQAYEAEFDARWHEKEAAEDNDLYFAQEELSAYPSDDVETFEEWRESEQERQKEQEMDDCRQEMREYLNDDY
jgi:hypothetical protein